MNRFFHFVIALAVVLLSNNPTYAQQTCANIHAQESLRAIIFKHVPDHYRVQPGPDGKITVYRGDRRSAYSSGLISKALHAGRADLVAQAKAIVESQDENAIARLIDKHTTSSRLSPFISASFNPKVAQLFVRPGVGTIYKITIDASRVIVDADDIGKTGAGGEVLIIGKILEHEIEAIKINNEVANSELVIANKNGGIWLMKYDNVRDDDSRTVIDPENWSKP